MYQSFLHSVSLYLFDIEFIVSQMPTPCVENIYFMKAINDIKTIK